jgi:hypothetical protein
VHTRLTKESRTLFMTVLKPAIWTIAAIIVLRGCISALNGDDATSVGNTRPPGVAAQSGPTQESENAYPWANAPLGSTLSGPWHNTTGQTTILYIDGVRTTVFNGDLVTVSGVVVYDRRYKCKALRVEGEDSAGRSKPVYFFLSKPTPASFFDCTPEE